jgi:hypothetical protein
MLRHLVDRFAYRYRLWSAETRSDNVRAGTEPPDISPKSEPTWRLILRFLQMLAGGLIFLAILYRFAMRTFPRPRRRHPDDFHLSCGRLVRRGIVHDGWRATHEIEQE